MSYTHFLLFTDTRYGCTVQMATLEERDDYSYNIAVAYNSVASMLEDYEYLFRFHNNTLSSTFEGYTAEELRDVLYELQ